MTFSLSNIRDTLLEIESMVEDKGHLDHPEDLVFLSGISGVNRALQGIEATIKNPKIITIKFDGYPALIFGVGPDKKFTIMDKHMFNKKDGTGRKVFSPEQFVQYDLDRGVNRESLHKIVENIWPGLEKACYGNVGYYWGDLLFHSPLIPNNGMYTFKANPNGITYTIDIDSEVGKLLTGKSAGIAVHQYIQPTQISTDDATPLDGSIGKLKNNSNIAIVPSKMPNTPKLKNNRTLVNNVKKAIAQYGPAVEQLMSNTPQNKTSFSQLFTVYVNKKIVSGNLNNLIKDFMGFINNRPLTSTMKEKIIKHIQENKNGIVGVFSIWISVYHLKMDVVSQLNIAALNSPVKGYLQDGTETQEGFVSQGLKFVDRMGFSRQNLLGR